MRYLADFNTEVAIKGSNFAGYMDRSKDRGLGRKVE